MSGLKTRLERLEEAAMVRRENAFKDVPLETILWLAFGDDREFKALPEGEVIVRGLFSDPPAQIEFLPLALRLIRFGLTEEAAHFVARAVQGEANQTEARMMERGIAESRKTL